MVGCQCPVSICWQTNRILQMSWRNRLHKEDDSRRDMADDRVKGRAQGIRAEMREFKR